MAEVPYQGVQSVQPETQAPDDYQRIQASPAAFGGLIAQGEQKVGAGLSVAGKFYGQVAADDATNQYMDGTHKILYGTGQIDPATGQPDQGYYGLKGRAALDARPQVEAKLAELQKTVRGNLVTPEQQLQYDSNTRRMQYLLTSEMGQFGAQQGDVYAANVNKTGYENTVQSVAARPEDDVYAAYAVQQALGYQTKLAQVMGTDNDPETLQQIRTKTAQDITEARVKALIPTNAPKAMAILQKNQPLLQSSANFDALYSATQTKLVQQQGTQIGRDAINSAGSDLINPGTAQTINQAILGQESNDNDNSPPGAAKPGQQPAIGPAQILPATFAQYARPGEDINNPQDNRAVANRVIDDLSSKYPGDPARVAVGYFSGPGNVAPAGSPSPWINNAKDANGKTVSSYVSDITKRLANASPGTALKASAFDRVMSATDDPQIQREALSYVREQYDAAQIATLADKQAREDASNTAASGYITQMMKGQTTPDLIGKIANDPAFDSDPTKKEQLWNLALSARTGSDAEKASEAYGPGFWGAYKSLTDSSSTERITNQNQIMSRAGPGGDLTLAGVDKLMSVLQGKKTPEGEAEARMQSGAFNVVKRDLSGEDLLPGMKDPKGEKIFQHALPLLYQAIEQGKAKGIPAGQLYDPESKDWIGNVVAGLKRSPDQYLSDIVNSDSGQAGQAVTDIAKMNVAQLADAYYAAKTPEERQRYADEAVKRGLAKPNEPAAQAPGAPVAPAAPSAQ